MIFDPENGNKTRRKERKLWVTFPVWLQRVALHLAKGEHYCLSVSNFRCLFWIKSGAKRRPHWARPKTPQKTQIREEPLGLFAKVRFSGVKANAQNGAICTHRGVIEVEVVEVGYLRWWRGSTVGSTACVASRRPSSRREVPRSGKAGAKRRTQCK